MPEFLRPAWFTSTNTGSYFAEDLDRIPDLPPHTELIDGNLIFAGAEALFHFMAINAIKSAMQRAAPSHLFTAGEMAAVDEVALSGIGHTGFDAAREVLVVEADSPESGTRDRKEKRGLYAATGIIHLWHVDDAGGTTVIEVWKLNQDLGSYDLVGEFTNALEVEDPFPVALDLWDLGELRN